MNSNQGLKYAYPNTVGNITDEKINYDAMPGGKINGFN